MSAEYPKRGMTEWNYRKGDLDDATKKYATSAAKVAKDRGGLIHFFAVGQTLEQPDVGWLKDLAAAGHPVGNHTYDHVNVMAAKPEDIQHRFRRAPWLIRGKTVAQVIEENIASTTLALKERCGITASGFRTPGGFRDGLKKREDLQKMLLKQGFTWCSSLYPSHTCGKPKEEPAGAVYADIVKASAAAQPFAYPSGLVEVPMSPVSDVNAFRTHYWKLDWFLKAVRLAVEEAIKTGGVFDFLAHPSCLVVEDPTFETVKLICALVEDAGDKAAIVGLDEIAKGVQ
jgi:peptidoglycan/xylan/chitin deacetylase (PgdA/CDA1 family)